jgi:hypothetical protein
MSTDENIEKYKIRIRELESQLSALKLELKETKIVLAEETEKQKFYQLIADFAFGWELHVSTGEVNVNK